MTLIKTALVLLISMLFVGCSDSKMSSSEGYVTTSFRIKDASVVSSDGSLLIQLTDDDSVQDQYYGKTFWVNINRLSVEVDTRSDGTYIIVSGPRGVSGVDLSRIYEATMVVRTGRQKDVWDNFLSGQRTRIYGPRDVLPPQQQNSR